MKEFKKCKGINKAHGYEGCGELVPTKERVAGLCKVCYWDWMQTTEGGKIHYHKQFLPKVEKTIERNRRKKEKEEKEALTDYKVKLQDKVNEIVRLIDSGLPCLARNHHANQIHAGHVYARGGNSNMKYNLHNIHRQGAHSNHYQNDDGLLREGVVREYGQLYMDFISELRRTPVVKYQNWEYKDFYKKACGIFNDMKRSGVVFKTELQRISIRNKVNARLGIYDKEFCVYELEQLKND